MFVSTIDNRTKTKLTIKACPEDEAFTLGKNTFGCQIGGRAFARKGCIFRNLNSISTTLWDGNFGHNYNAILICKVILLFFYGIFNILEHPQTNQHVRCAYADHLFLWLAHKRTWWYTFLLWTYNNYYSMPLFYTLVRTCTRTAYRVQAYTAYNSISSTYTYRCGLFKWRRCRGTRSQ